MDKHTKNTGLKGAEELRAVVRFINDRPEGLNENKTALQLINDYRRYMKKFK